MVNEYKLQADEYLNKNGIEKTQELDSNATANVDNEAIRLGLQTLDVRLEPTPKGCEILKENMASYNTALAMKAGTMETLHENKASFGWMSSESVNVKNELAESANEVAKEKCGSNYGAALIKQDFKF